MATMAQGRRTVQPSPRPKPKLKPKRATAAAQPPAVVFGSKALYSVADMVTLLSMSEAYVRRLVARDVLGSVKVGQRRLIPHAALERYLDGLTATTAAKRSA